MKKTMLILGIMATALGASSCGEKDLLISYDFNACEGTMVKDNGSAKADATLMDGAAVADGALQLYAPDAWLDMGTKAGEAVAPLRDFTVYVRYMMDADAEVRGFGHFLWCFSALPANAATEGPYHAYRINEQRVETSIGGFTQETGIQKSEVTELGKWITVVFRQSAGKGELFIDGQLIGTEEGFPEFADNFQEAPACNWMARPPFNGDRFLTKTRIDEFKVWSSAISDKRLEKLLNR